MCVVGPRVSALTSTPSTLHTNGATMHHSRLAGFIIDCNTQDLEKAAEFWGAALGYALKPKEQEGSAKYRQLNTGPDELHIEVQQVDHDSRVHLDIESDDIEAEVRRLESLGAKRVEFVHTWCVMVAPTGQRFCVVRQQRPGIESERNARG
jgi:predicted enzyme related to lactoylglutathione lyase